MIHKAHPTNIPLLLLAVVLAASVAQAATVVGDWPFDRTADGVAVAEGQPVLEEATAGLFDASGHSGMGLARHYPETSPPGPAAALVYARWKSASARGQDGCGLDTSDGGVYFPDGAPQLKARSNFSVWTRVQPLNAETARTEVVLGRVGVWLLCRQQGRLETGLAGGEAVGNQAGIRDLFAGTGPVLQTGHWYDLGLSVGPSGPAGVEVKVYLNGALVRQATETSPPQGDAPFQIGGCGLSTSVPDSKFLYDQVVFYDGVLDPTGFARLTRRGGPSIAKRSVVVEPLRLSYWWSAEGLIGHGSGYQRLKWNPKVGAYGVSAGSFPVPGPGGDLYLRHQCELFQPVLAPEQGHFGAGSLAAGGSARYAIASYFIPQGYDHQRRKLVGALYLHGAKGEPPSGAKLRLQVYVNDDLKLEQGVPAQAEAATFVAELGRLVPGDRVYAAFAPTGLSENGEFWFDYSLKLLPSGGPRLPATCPVAEAFRVKTTEALEEKPEWSAAHYQLCAQASTNRVELLLVGDSVTAAWAWTGKAVWEKHLLRYHPGNFGISGQGTQDVLWRLNHRELEGIHPKAIVVLLGSNDINWPVADIVAGVKEVVRQLRAQFPASPLLLGGILPRGEQPGTEERRKILEANAQLAALADGRRIHYFYFGDKLLLADGRLPKEIAPDFLHPRESGYQLWAEAIEPLLEPLWKQNPLNRP